MFVIDREKQRDISGLWSRIYVNSVEVAGRRNTVPEHKCPGRCFRTGMEGMRKGKGKA